MLAAVCAWYREPVAALDRMVRSLVGAVDVLVCLDGAWVEFPDAAESSPLEEHGAIKEAARAIGLDVWIPPPRLFESQVEKRAELYRIGAETGASHLLVLDADEWIERVDVDRLRAMLADSDRLLGTVHMAGPDGRMGVRRRVFSAREGLTVETAHNGVCTLSGRYLAGDGAYVPLETPVDLTGVLELGHDRGALRSKARNDADHMYRMVRRANQSERWKRERAQR